MSRLPDLLEACIPGLDADPLEDEISRRLVLQLQRDPDTRNIGHYISEYRLLEDDANGDVVTKGFIDIAVLFDRDQERYLALECKRLNVRRGKTVASLATQYVREGMMRYVEAKYARNLPFGGMVGYVLDGDAERAEKRILKAIKDNSAILQSKSIPANLPKAGTIRRLSSKHNRRSESFEFEIRHSLFPVSVVAAKAPPMPPLPKPGKATRRNTAKEPEGSPVSGDKSEPRKKL